MQAFGRSSVVHKGVMIPSHRRGLMMARSSPKMRNFKPDNPWSRSKFTEADIQLAIQHHITAIGAFRNDSDHRNDDNNQSESAPVVSGLELPNQGTAVVEGTDAIDRINKQLMEILKPPKEDYLAEFLALQENKPRNVAFFGTRHLGVTHAQLVEVLAYALVLTGNHIFTSGSTGVNAAVIKGALRAENPELLTVILPQSLSKQPEESQELLRQVEDLIEMPDNDELSLLEASRVCNKEIVARSQQVITFAFHDSSLLMQTCDDAKRESKIVTLFYLD